MQIAYLLILSVVYAVVRYVAFAPQNAEHIPIFILNKAVSMAAALTLVAALWSRYRGTGEVAGRYFRFTLALVIMHVPMSLTVLRPGYFPEFFESDGARLRLMGELVFLFGATALALLWFLSQGQLIAKLRDRLGLLLLAVISAHVGAMGICRGVHFNAKHAYLPPMWMLSLIALIIGVVLSLRRSVQGGGDSQS
jgi:hypothetical protein